MGGREWEARNGRLGYCFKNQHISDHSAWHKKILLKIWIRIWWLTAALCQWPRTRMQFPGPTGFLIAFLMPLFFISQREYFGFWVSDFWIPLKIPEPGAFSSGHSDLLGESGGNCRWRNLTIRYFHVEQISFSAVVYILNPLLHWLLQTQDISTGWEGERV